MAFSYLTTLFDPMSLSARLLSVHLSHSPGHFGIYALPYLSTHPYFVSLPLFPFCLLGSAECTLPAFSEVSTGF